MSGDMVADFLFSSPSSLAEKNGVLNGEGVWKSDITLFGVSRQLSGVGDILRGVSKVLDGVSIARRGVRTVATVSPSSGVLSRGVAE